MKTMSQKTLIPSRVTRDSKKGQRILDLVGAVINKLGLDEDQAQRVIENPEFPPAVEAVLRTYAIPNEYADEEVSSNYGYLSGYREAAPIADQMRILREYFPNLGDPDESFAKQERPANSEGYFCIPRWKLIAPTYNEAVERVLEALNKQRKGKFVNYHKGELGPDRLRQGERKRLAFERLTVEQGRDVLVVAAQFGFQHHGRSVRRARAVMPGIEFGLGAFEIGIMLLTHAIRLQHLDDLWIDCPGDEYSPDAGGRFGDAPYFYFGNGKLEFGTDLVGNASGRCGSASGFLPAEATAKAGSPQ
jgi:hypothetical protein